MLRPLLGPRSSSSEHLKQLCVVGDSSSERFLLGASAGRYSFAGASLSSEPTPWQLRDLRWGGQQIVWDRVVLG
eukprot:13598552-Alexandrium_andersonii.AAC.1